MGAVTPDELLSYTLDDFDSYSLTDPIPMIFPGVYIFLDADGKALYVGESGSVQVRVKAHRTKKWYKHVKSLKILKVSGGVSARLVVETMMIFRVRPRWNQAVKIGIDSEGQFYSLQWLKSSRK